MVATGDDGDGPWVQVAEADFLAETGVPGDPTRLTAAIGPPIVLCNAAADPQTDRVVLDASGKPAIYMLVYIGHYIGDDHAAPVDWNLVDGLDLAGSHQGGGVHIQDSICMT